METFLPRTYPLLTVNPHSVNLKHLMLLCAWFPKVLVRFHFLGCKVLPWVCNGESSRSRQGTSRDHDLRTEFLTQTCHVSLSCWACEVREVCIARYQRLGVKDKMLSGPTFWSHPSRWFLGKFPVEIPGIDFFSCTRGSRRLQYRLKPIHFSRRGECYHGDWTGAPSPLSRFHWFLSQLVFWRLRVQPGRVQCSVTISVGFCASTHLQVEVVSSISMFLHSRQPHNIGKSPTKTLVANRVYRRERVVGWSGKQIMWHEDSKRKRNTSN